MILKFCTVSLWIAALFSQSSLSSSIDTTVQVDLIFPRNNTVYQPVFPFPFVFGLHNFSTSWNYKPAVTWRLLQLTTEREIDEGRGRIGEGYGEGAPAGWGPPAAKYLAINASNSMARTNESTWVLEYGFVVGNDLGCFGKYIRDDDFNYPGRRDRIFFNISKTSGSMPDIRADGSCPPSIGVVGIQGPNQTNPACPLLSTPRPDPIPCAFTVDQQVVDQVSQSMVERSKCHNVTWPNGTGIGFKCDPSIHLTKSSWATKQSLHWTLSIGGLSIFLFLVSM
ncbi:hypothetical protein BT63DRAFT_462168 [Microthyrium microscopicum]|uniref:DUF7136 domain-containing protein n=1 Tax=Microthyrium microscopicum TaxID=703497 RepID=A0A6A6UU80_9PEZI|nr:hypothetical protein BT63DRAFT_462168 [Microthyrium microscopicum]